METEITTEEKLEAKIHIRLTSFNSELLVYSCQQLTNILQDIPFNTSVIATLPTRKRIYCVLRSPHVDKDSREHFEIRVHKRIVDLYHEPKYEAKILDLLSEVVLPSGVSYRVCLS